MVEWNSKFVFVCGFYSTITVGIIHTIYELFIMLKKPIWFQGIAFSERKILLNIYIPVIGWLLVRVLADVTFLRSSQQLLLLDLILPIWLFTSYGYCFSRSIVGPLILYSSLTVFTTTFAFLIFGNIEYEKLVFGYTAIFNSIMFVLYLLLYKKSRGKVME